MMVARDITAAALTVRIPGLLRSYTEGASEVTLDCAASTLDDALRALDRRYPGLRFRIVDEQDRVRPHIKLFVDAALARDLAMSIDVAHELVIVGALSGG